MISSFCLTFCKTDTFEESGFILLPNVHLIISSQLDFDQIFVREISRTDVLILLRTPQNGVILFPYLLFHFRLLA